MSTLRVMGDPADDGDGIGHSAEIDAGYPTVSHDLCKSVFSFQVMRARNKICEMKTSPASVRRR
jgi:hypothetical protein